MEIIFYTTRTEAVAAAEGLVLQSSTGTTHLPLIDFGFTTKTESGEREIRYYISQKNAKCGSLGQIRNFKSYHGSASAIGAGEITCKKCSK